MSNLPQQFLVGQSVQSIRRTLEGIFLLTPTRDSLKLIRYTFALGVEASGMIPHAEITMSNHRQGVFTDLTGLRANFHQRLHGVYSEQYNGLLGRGGIPLWDRRGTSQPVLLSSAEGESCFAFACDESEEEQLRWISRWDALGLTTMQRTIAYVLCNPMAANLVQHLNSFPGFKITPSDWGKWNVEHRPGFVDLGRPEVAAFMALPPAEYWDKAEFIDTGDTRFIVSPDILAAFEERRAWARKTDPRGVDRFDPTAFELFISPENLQNAKDDYSALVEILEEQFQQEREAAGKRVFGRANILAQDPLYKPPAQTDPTRKRPRFKLRFTGSAFAVAKAQAAYSVFCKTYWRQLTRFKNDRDFSVVFPAGTVKMAEVANVRCRGAPLPEENPML